MPLKVLVAGIGGASLGTEIIKALQLSGNYEIYGCDISPLAYGHYGARLKESFLVDRHQYTDSVLSACQKRGVRYIIPGGEEPNTLLGKAAGMLH